MEIPKDAKKRRSSLRKSIYLREDDKKMTPCQQKRRISFSGKHLVREFRKEEEPKIWDNSYEIPDQAGVASKQCSSANKEVRETKKDNAECASEKQEIHYFQNSTLCIENSVDVTLFDNEKQCVAKQKFHRSLNSFSWEDYELSPNICEKTFDFMENSKRTDEDKVNKIGFKDEEFLKPAMPSKGTKQINTDKENIQPTDLPNTNSFMDIEGNFDFQYSNITKESNEFEKKLDALTGFKEKQDNLLTEDMHVEEPKNFKQRPTILYNQVIENCLNESTNNVRGSNNLVEDIEVSPVNSVKTSELKNRKMPSRKPVVRKVYTPLAKTAKTLERRYKMKSDQENDENAKLLMPKSNVLKSQNAAGHNNSLNFSLCSDKNMSLSPESPASLLIPSEYKDYNFKQLNDEIERGKIQLFSKTPTSERKQNASINHAQSLNKHRKTLIFEQDMIVATNLDSKSICKTAESEDYFNFDTTHATASKASDLNDYFNFDSTAIQPNITKNNITRSDDMNWDNTSYLVTAKLGDSSTTHNYTKREDTNCHQVDLLAKSLMDATNLEHINCNDLAMYSESNSSSRKTDLEIERNSMVPIKNRQTIYLNENIDLSDNEMQKDESTNYLAKIKDVKEDLIPNVDHDIDAKQQILRKQSAANMELETFSCRRTIHFVDETMEFSKNSDIMEDKSPISAAVRNKDVLSDVEASFVYDNNDLKMKTIHPNVDMELDQSTYLKNKAKKISEIREGNKLSNLTATVASRQNEDNLEIQIEKSHVEFANNDMELDQSTYFKNKAKEISEIWEGNKLSTAAVNKTAVLSRQNEKHLEKQIKESHFELANNDMELDQSTYFKNKAKEISEIWEGNKLSNPTATVHKTAVLSRQNDEHLEKQIKESHFELTNNDMELDQSPYFKNKTKNISEIREGNKLTNLTTIAVPSRQNEENLDIQIEESHVELANIDMELDQSPYFKNKTINAMKISEFRESNKFSNLMETVSNTAVPSRQNEENVELANNDMELDQSPYFKNKSIDAMNISEIRERKKLFNLTNTTAVPSKQNEENLEILIDERHAVLANEATKITGNTLNESELFVDEKKQSSAISPDIKDNTFELTPNKERKCKNSKTTRNQNELDQIELESYTPNVYATKIKEDIQQKEIANASLDESGEFQQRKTMYFNQAIETEDALVNCKIPKKHVQLEQDNNKKQIKKRQTILENLNMDLEESACGQSESNEMKKSNFCTPIRNHIAQMKGKQRSLFKMTPRSSWIEFMEYEKQMEFDNVEDFVSEGNDQNCAERNELSKKRFPINLTPISSLAKKRQTLLFQNCALDESICDRDSEGVMVKGQVELNTYLDISGVNNTPLLQSPKQQRHSQIPILVNSRKKVNTQLHSRVYENIDMDESLTFEKIDNSIPEIRKCPVLPDISGIIDFEAEQKLNTTNNHLNFEENPITISDVTEYFQHASKLSMPNCDLTNASALKENTFKKHYLNITCNGSPEDIEQTRLSLVRTLSDDDDTLKPSQEQTLADKCLVEIQSCSPIQAVDSVDNAVEFKSKANQTQNMSVMCRKCKRCQDTFVADASTSETFKLPTSPPVPTLNFDRLRQLRSRPHIQDVNNLWHRISLDRTISINNASVCNFTLPNIEDCVSENISNDNIKPFRKYLNKIKRLYSKNWICDFQNQCEQTIIFSYKAISTFALIITYENCDDFRQGIKLKNVKIEKSLVDEKEWEPVDFILDFLVKLSLPIDLLSLCEGNNESGIFKLMNTIDEVCKDTYVMVNELQRIVCLNKSSIIRDGHRTFVRKIIRKVDSACDPQKRVKTFEFRIEILNLKKLNYKDIILPSLYNFREDVKLLPDGLPFLIEFLKNPLCYLKDSNKMF